jgi:hypothetical protein
LLDTYAYHFRLSRSLKLSRRHASKSNQRIIKFDVIIIAAGQHPMNYNRKKYLRESRESFSDMILELTIEEK